MKKFISIFLSFVLLLGVVLNMSSCGLDILLAVGGVALFHEEIADVLEDIFDHGSDNIIAPEEVDLSMYCAEGWEDPNETTWTDASKGTIIDYEYWEPGMVVAKHIQVFNDSPLYVRCHFMMGTEGEPTMLTDVIDVYVIPEVAQIKPGLSIPEAYYVGNLTAAMNGNLLLDTVMMPGDATWFTVVLKMQESAGNEYQIPMNAQFSVRVIAEPVESEMDWMN